MCGAGPGAAVVCRGLGLGGGRVSLDRNANPRLSVRTPGLRQVAAVRRAYPTFGGMVELGAVGREMWPAGVQGTPSQVRVGLVRVWLARAIMASERDPWVFQLAQRLKS